jgi:DNA-binding NarL/FixJ family response regulator
MAPKGYRHVTRDQRCQLQTMLSMGMLRKEIAEELGVSEKSSV